MNGACAHWSHHGMLRAWVATATAMTTGGTSAASLTVARPSWRGVGTGDEVAWRPCQRPNVTSAFA